LRQVLVCNSSALRECIARLTERTSRGCRKAFVGADLKTRVVRQAQAKKHVKKQVTEWADVLLLG